MPRILIAVLCCVASALACAQQPLFRYIDKNGKVVYTDTAPPSDAKSVQQKKLGGNYIETSEAPYSLQIAQQRNPVTLYSGACGPLCDSARALLNRRGVPFKEVDPSTPGELQKMVALTGDQRIPVLMVGSTNVLKGFEDDRWQAALDQAGYPKTPTTRITAIKRDADKVAADKAAAKATAAKAEPKGDAKDAKADVRSDGKADASVDVKGDVRAAAAPDKK